MPRERIPELEIALQRCHREHFCAEPLLIVWCEVPRGQGWTEGRLSDVSWLMVEVEDGLEPGRREHAMKALAAAFAGVAQVPIERVLITLADARVFAEYLAANRQRLRPLGRLRYLATIAGSIWASRRRHGFASIPANL